jgi:hypothetical protein
MIWICTGLLALLAIVHVSGAIAITRIRDLVDRHRMPVVLKVRVRGQLILGLGWICTTGKLFGGHPAFLTVAIAGELIACDELLPVERQRFLELVADELGTRDISIKFL